MNLLYPIGLLALAGLIIPVLLHLWNVKQGKTLKIGSIALLGENSSSSAKSLKITGWLLFILRCLIVILVAVVLAQPFIKKTITNAKSTGWILADRNQFAKVYQSNKSTIDSLVNLGFELHDFNLGFKAFSLKDSTEKIESITGLSYYNLLNQLNKQIPVGNSVYLFAGNKLNKLDGDLPKLNFNLIWKEFNEGDTLKTWSTKFLGRVYEGKSTPNLTNYTSEQSQDLPVIKVVIHDPQGDDSKYIKAGLIAISDFTKRKIEVKNWSSTTKDADVIFWLTEQIFNTSLKAGANLLTYQKGKPLKVVSSINLGANQFVDLKQRVASDDVKGYGIWTDGFGVPILIKKKEAKINHFYFYSRFNPQWSNLVWNEQFIKALIPLVLGNENTNDFGFEDNAADQRVVDQQQLISTKTSISTASTSVKNQDLDHVFWVFALFVLFLERILSFRKKLAHGKS